MVVHSLNFSLLNMLVVVVVDAVVVAGIAAEAERERRGDDVQVGEQPGQPDAQDRAEGHLGMVQG